jgi:ATP/maltotriose-dependent transcriptional regulator MalT
MAATHDKSGELKHLDEELVPLSVAGRVAYSQLVDKQNRISIDPDLGRVLPLVAAALSAVAPIHKRPVAESEESRPLTTVELEAALFRPGVQPRTVLDELYIRRGDLHRAIETLRTANQYFGKKT